jgi:hypothetical protein
MRDHYEGRPAWPHFTKQDNSQTMAGIQAAQQMAALFAQSTNGESSQQSTNQNSQTENGKK